MAIVCPACGTENRSVAKFCIECIAPLPGHLAAKQVPPAPAAAPEADGLPSVLAAFASAGPRGPLMPPMPLPPAPKRRGTGIVVGVFVLVLLVAGAIAWLVAGGEAWRSRVTGTGAARQAAGAVEVPVAPPTPPVAGEPPTPAEALAPGETIVAVDPPAPAAPRIPATPATPAPPAAAAPQPTTATVPLADTAKAAPSPARPERAVPAAASFFAGCEGLSFIANSRCKVDLCDQNANRQRQECQPVMAQQRLMEEKRNPTLAN